MANLSSSSWIELAVLPPGQSHYWFFDHPRDLHGWVFQATAHPECVDDESAAETSVEVSELFVLCKVAESQDCKRSSQVNITVTNYSGRWAPYSLWVVAVPVRNGPANAPSLRFSPEGKFLKQESRARRTPGMKTLIVHDEYGNIRSIATGSRSTERLAGLRVQRGEFVAEIELWAAELEELRRHPCQFCEKFRFDRDAGRLLTKNP